MGRIEYEYPLFKVYYSNNSNNSNIRGNPGTPLLLGGGCRQELHHSPDVSRGQAAQLRVEAGQHLGRYLDSRYNYHYTRQHLLWHLLVLLQLHQLVLHTVAGSLQPRAGGVVRPSSQPRAPGPAVPDHLQI